MKFLIPNYKESNSNISYWYDWMNCKYKALSNYYDQNVECPTLVQLFRSQEAENAVPTYQFIIENETDKDILLPFVYNGKYRLVIQNRESRIEKLIELN